MMMKKLCSLYLMILMHVGVWGQIPSTSSKLTLSGTAQELLKLEYPTGKAGYIRGVKNGVNNWYVGNGSSASDDLHFTNYRPANISFGTNSSSRMIINSAGNVGIGTTNPASKLDVNGEIRSGYGGYTGIQLATYYWSGSHGLLFNSYKDVHTEGSLAVNTRYANDVGGYFGGAGSIFFYGNGGTMDFCISPSSTGKDNVVEWGDPKLKIFRNGNVAIGKTTADHKLDVAGTIRAEEILVEAQTADFVFESDYNLRDLSEVENFIKINKHLPEIPSAAQMEKQGVNLAEMNKLLLQKVEELTLYSIDLQKQDKEIRDKLRDKNKEVKELNEARKTEQNAREKMEERLAKIEALLLSTTPNLP